jgi:hypothetical protein
MLGDDGQDLFRLGLASQLDVEIARLELEQLGQQSGVVDVQVIQGDEVVQDASAGVELEGEPSFGEVKLDDVRAGLQRVPGQSMMAPQVRFTIAPLIAPAPSEARYTAVPARSASRGSRPSSVSFSRGASSSSVTPG